MTVKTFKSIIKPGMKVTERGARAERKREAKARAYQAANKAHGTSGKRGRK